MIGQRAHLALGIALSVSVLAHGWILTRPSQTRSSLGGHASSTLALTVVAREVDSGPATAPEQPRTIDHQPAQAPRRDAKPKRKAIASKQASSQKTAPAHAATRQDSQKLLSPQVTQFTTAKAATTRAAPMTASVDSTDVLAVIKTDLARHFNYPRIARQRGWEGEVILAFILKPNGNIETIEIHKSSGHAILDRSAQTALTKVPSIALGDLELVSARRLQLPVHYRLGES